MVSMITRLCDRWHTHATRVRAHAQTDQGYDMKMNQVFDAWVAGLQATERGDTPNAWAHPMWSEMVKKVQYNDSGKEGRWVTAGRFADTACAIFAYSVWGVVHVS